jgi:quercetin dioxygenase-like cupin family protein
MAILRGLRYRSVSDWGDPDDFRPTSRLALAADPGDESGQVHALSLIFEVVGPGDVGALHRHPTDEAIFIDDGELEVRIGDRVERIGPEEVAFVPRNVPHGWKNVGTTELRLRAVFPSDVLAIEMLERTPAPGTEGDNPQPPSWIDVRSVIGSS